MDRLCKSRNRKDLKSLSKLQTIIVEYYAKYCIQNKKGDIQLAYIILNKTITKEDLINECKRLGIKGYYNKSKSQLEILCNEKNKKKKTINELTFSDLKQIDIKTVLSDISNVEERNKIVIHIDDKTILYKLDIDDTITHDDIIKLYIGYKHPILILYTKIKNYYLLMVTELTNFIQSYTVYVNNLGPISIEIFKYYKKIFNFIIDLTKNDSKVYQDYDYLKFYSDHMKQKHDEKYKEYYGEQDNQDNYYSNEKSERIKFCTKILCDNKITDKKQLYKYSLIHHPDKYEGNNKEENTDKYKDVITCWNELKDDKFVCK